MTNSPWIDIPREQWASLARANQASLDDRTVRQLRGLKDPTDVTDVTEVYLPLTRLVNFHRLSHDRIYADINDFLGISPTRTPFVIGVSGSVAVGKSTTARLLQELLRRSPDSPRVDLVTTDGFLYPNAILEERGLLTRKGFPESYDRQALLDFVIAVKSGQRDVTAPVYSHITYDIVPEARICVNRPQILIVEGINVLQPALPSSRNDRGLSVSDFFDFSVYVDADASDIRRWFRSRFLALRQTAFSDPDSYFKGYASLSDEEAVEAANNIWDSINAVNLVENIEPHKNRATVILRKGSNHLVESVRMRKI